MDFLNSVPQFVTTLLIVLAVLAGPQLIEGWGPWHTTAVIVGGVVFGIAWMVLADRK